MRNQHTDDARRAQGQVTGREEAEQSCACSVSEANEKQYIDEVEQSVGEYLQVRQKKKKGRKGGI